LGALAGATAAVAVPGCRTEADVAPPSHAFKPPTSLPQRSVPDAVPSHTDGVPAAYLGFPKHPYRSVQRRPGNGGSVTTLQILWGPPPTPLTQNPWWQDLNRRLGVRLEPLLAPDSSFGDKLMTVMASGGLPDLTYIHTDYAPGILRSVMQGAFTELSKYLSGDAIKEFPNLGQLPTYAWKNAAVEGGIYGVPRPIPIVNGRVGIYRRDWARKLGYPHPPANSDEFYELFTAFAKSKLGQGGRTWAMGNIDTALIGQMFRVPNNWRLNKDGTLTHAIETDEMVDSLQFQRRLWSAGAIHPDGPNLSSQQLEDLFITGKTAYYTAGYIPLFGVSGMRGSTIKANKGADQRPFIPPGHDGGKATMYQGPGYYGYMGIPSKIGKNEERTRELLRILDYFAAPFGSEEYVFMTYGLEGKQFNYNNAGTPVAIDNPSRANWMNLNYMCETQETAFYFPGMLSDATLAQNALEVAVAQSIRDPTLGLVSETSINRAPALSQLNDDYQTGIVSGHRSMGALKEWRSRWRNGGGDQMRHELEESLARIHGG
jgi:putative aldouronate transport system substrate-binding protein